MLITKSSQIGRLLFGNQPWRGEQDLSARIFTMYDKTYLYAGADVTDDSVVTHWDFPRMSYPWDTDAMEVVFDTRVNSAQGTDPPHPRIVPRIFRWRNTAQRISVPTRGKGRGGGATPAKTKPCAGAETYTRLRRDGYSMIVRYPLSSLQGVSAQRRRDDRIRCRDQ